MTYEYSQLADWRTHGHHEKVKKYEKLVERAGEAKQRAIDHLDAAVEELAAADLVSSERGRLIEALWAARGVVAAGDWRPHPGVVDLEGEAV